MDVFSHGLWGAAGAKLATKKTGVTLNPWKAAWWGVFPDVFAFGPLFFWLFYRRILNEPTVLPRPENAAVIDANAPYVYNLAHYLYNYSHSIVIFSVVIVCIVFLKYVWWKKRSWATLIPWEMGAWLLHILCDIPTHSYKFYATPFLWPISEFKFNGFSWGVWWFILANYTAIGIVYLAIWRMKSKEPLKNIE